VAELLERDNILDFKQKDEIFKNLMYNQEKFANKFGEAYN
jgi:hypothetical protein